jgi:hypothetical protein
MGNVILTAKASSSKMVQDSSLEVCFRMTPKITTEVPIPGNSTLFGRQHTKIPHKSKLMIRQSPVFDDAATIRTKTKASKARH